MTALLVALVLSQAGTEDVSGTMSTASNVVVFRASFTSTGAPTSDDANTTLHCLGENHSSNVLTCQTGGGWSTVGTVGTTSASPFYPTGFSGPSRMGMGRFSAGNFFLWPTTTGPLDFTGPWYVCATFLPMAAETGILVSDGHCGGNKGFYLQVDSSGTAVGVFDNCAVLTTTNLVAYGGPNTACMGWSGSQRLLKLNDGPLVSGDAASYTADTSLWSTLGVYGQQASGFFNGYLLDVVASKGVPSDGLFTSIIKRSAGQVGTHNEPITINRTSVGTYVIGGTVYTAPVGVARIESTGLVVEPPKTNLARHYNDLPGAAWVNVNSGTPVTVTGDTVLAPDGTTTADTLAFPVVTTGSYALLRLTSPSVPAGGTTYAASVWLKAGTLSSVFITLGDGTGATGATSCPLSATWTRCVVTLTTTASPSSLGFSIGFEGAARPNAVADGSVHAWGAQMELGLRPSRLIATTTSTASRTTEEISIGNPLKAGDKDAWCVDLVASPPDGSAAAWPTTGDVLGFWAVGNYGTANTVAAEWHPTTGRLYLGNYDNAGAFCGVYWAGLAAGKRRITSCFNGDVRTSSVYVDGTKLTGGTNDCATGTGTLSTMPGTFYLGRSTTARPYDGTVERFALSRSSDFGRL